VNDCAENGSDEPPRSLPSSKRPASGARPFARPLKAALAVVRRGPDTLKDSIDPFGDGPFEHQVLENACELKTNLRCQEQPVTLTIGRKPQQ